MTNIVKVAFPVHAHRLRDRMAREVSRAETDPMKAEYHQLNAQQRAFADNMKVKADEVFRNMPMADLINWTECPNTMMAGWAIVIFHTRLGDCAEITWDDLTVKQQARWTQLVQGG